MCACSALCACVAVCVLVVLCAVCTAIFTILPVHLQILSSLSNVRLSLREDLLLWVSWLSSASNMTLPTLSLLLVCVHVCVHHACIPVCVHAY